MSQIYKCDTCQKEFGGPLDQISSNGKMYDICAMCRKILSEKRQAVTEAFIEGGKNG